MRCRVGTPGREPDILHLREENFGRLRENYLDGPADLAVEIVSPESVRRDRIAKFTEYEAGGVGEYWIINPADRTAEFYVRDFGSSSSRRAPVEGLTEESGGVYTCAMLGGLVVNVAWLFATSLPSLAPIVRAWQAVPEPNTP